MWSVLTRPLPHTHASSPHPRESRPHSPLPMRTPNNLSSPCYSHHVASILWLAIFTISAYPYFLCMFLVPDNSTERALWLAIPIGVDFIFLPPCLMPQPATDGVTAIISGRMPAYNGGALTRIHILADI
jgi:hypothetical protein